MNLAFWGFREWPFERTFALNRFFAAPIHDEALSRLLFLVEEQRRCGMLLGLSGTGKSFLLHLLQDRSRRMGRVTIRCEASCLTGIELCHQIAFNLNVPFDLNSSSAYLWQGIQNRLSAMAVIRQPLVIILDHVDRVESSVNQTIWRLRQVADSIGIRMTILLASRDRQIPQALKDLVELKIELSPWSSSEVSSFVRSSIIYAGVQDALFTDEAMNTIHDLTGGVPVHVMSLCHLSLLAAMGQEETLVSSEIVESVANEMPAIGGLASSPLQQLLEPALVASAS